MSVPRLFGSGLARQDGGQRRFAVDEALQRRLHVVKVFKGVEALGAPAQFAWSLRAAQQQDAEDGDLTSSEIKRFVNAMFVLRDTRIGAARGTGEILRLQTVECAANLFFGESGHGFAIVLLVTGVDQCIERERVVVGSGDVLFDEGTEDAGFSERERVHARNYSYPTRDESGWGGFYIILRGRECPGGRVRETRNCATLYIARQSRK